MKAPEKKVQGTFAHVRQMGGKLNTQGREKDKKRKAPKQKRRFLSKKKKKSGRRKKRSVRSDEVIIESLKTRGRKREGRKRRKEKRK